MSVCVPACVRVCAREEGLGGREDFSRFRTCYRGSMLHSRFKGVAGVFQTGTMSTLGREVNWKSMGTSVDRSDLGLWAIIRGIALAGWLVGRQTRVESVFRACRDRTGGSYYRHTPFRHEARIISIRL
jgi:hypothetical protein